MALSGSKAFGDATRAAEDTPQVFLTHDISANGLKKIYSKIEQQRKLLGKVAVKLHSGEPGGHHFPAPTLIKGLVQAIHGTIVECNTAYRGKRFETVGNHADGRVYIP